MRMIAAPAERNETSSTGERPCCSTSLLTVALIENRTAAPTAKATPMVAERRVVVTRRRYRLPPTATEGRLGRSMPRGPRRRPSCLPRGRSRLQRGDQAAAGRLDLDEAVGEHLRAAAVRVGDLVAVGSR